jgi:hypothetical protein
VITARILFLICMFNVKKDDNMKFLRDGEVFDSEVTRNGSRVAYFLGGMGILFTNSQSGATVLRVDFSISELFDRT